MEPQTPAPSMEPQPDATPRISEHLVALAREIADDYRTTTQPRASLLSGSAALGLSDAYSDIDLMMYYDTLPSDEMFQRAYQGMQGSAYQLLGKEEGREYAESFMIQGVECQIAHATIAAWQDDMDSVLIRLDVESPIQKALEGLLDGMPLYGEALIEEWKSLAHAYPDALAEAMIRHHFRFFPLWYIQERLATRDATLWFYQMLTETSFHILGTLAGVNHLYFSTFQFKRMSKFVGKMSLAPQQLAERIDGLFHTDKATAAQQLEALVQETVDIIQQVAPHIVAEQRPQLLGKRQTG